MSNGFEIHGITHLSASSLNAYVAQPALWICERLLQRRSPSSALMERGKAVEAGVHVGLDDPEADPADCIAYALQAYDRGMALSPDPRREHERKQIPGYVEHALAELRQYGIPSGYQTRVEIRLDDVPVPIIGFVDWLYDQHGLIVDLKTSEKHPAAINTNHGRQGAIYAAAHGNWGMRFAYTKPAPGKDGRAVVVYALGPDDVRRHLAALRQIAIRLERFLALSKDPQELAGLVCPDYDHFYWRNTAVRAMGQETYGF